jgi:small GTP-binding protein
MVARAVPATERGAVDMPMPHRTQAQVIRRRLRGKEGSARLRELQSILADLPDYKNGPYADLRKWVNEEIARTRVRSKTVHRDSIAVRREGAAQICLVGAPNAGKSSLLQALSNIQIKTGDYAFTTTRPVPATTRIGGVLVQLVEIPGLIEGANDDRGGGRALLGVLRSADGIVFCQPLDATVADLELVRREVTLAGIERPALIAATKADEGHSDCLQRLEQAADGLEVVPVSVLDDGSLDILREKMWELTGLIRVHLRHGDEVTQHPVALRPPVTVAGVAHTIHHELGDGCTGGRVWGPSARFPGQHVGRNHPLRDGDEVEIESA